MSETILPTHTCFDDALDYIEQLIHLKQRAFEPSRYAVVHGICVAPRGHKKGEHFAHGWVEETKGSQVFVWEGGILKSNGLRVWHSKTREEFWAELQPVKVTRYSLREVLQHNQRTGTYGPWEPEYVALCGAERCVYGEDG